MNRKLWMVLIIALITSAALACATVVPRLSFETMTDSSELIASGTIVRSWSAWDIEHKYIWTHYELRVTSAFKGAPASIVEFAEPGGSVNGNVMVIHGAVAYGIGDHVLVFLSRMPNRYLRTTGWSQGKYKLDDSEHLQGSVPESVGLTVADFRDRIAARARVAHPAGIR